MLVLLWQPANNMASDAVGAAKVPPSCLVCRKHLAPGAFDCVNTTDVLRASNKAVLGKLNSLLESNLRSLNLDVECICRRCFNLLDILENLEVMATNIKSDILTMFQESNPKFKDLSKQDPEPEQDGNPVANKAITPVSIENQDASEVAVLSRHLSDIGVTLSLKKYDVEKNSKSEISISPSTAAKTSVKDETKPVNAFEGSITDRSTLENGDEHSVKKTNGNLTGEVEDTVENECDAADMNMFLEQEMEVGSETVQPPEVPDMLQSPQVFQHLVTMDRLKYQRKKVYFIGFDT